MTLAFIIYRNALMWKKMTVKVSLHWNVFIHFIVYIASSLRNVVLLQWPADISEDFKILEWWEDLLKEPVNNNSHIINEHSPTPDSDLAETALWEFDVSQCREMAHLFNSYITMSQSCCSWSSESISMKNFFSLFQGFIALSKKNPKHDGLELCTKSHREYILFSGWI